MYFVLAFVSMGGVRFSYRVFQEIFPRKTGKKILVIGAGDAGEMIIRQMKNNSKLGFIPVAIVDDDPNKYDRQIHGVPVCGDKSEIESIVQKRGIEEIVIAVPSATSTQMQQIVSLCEKSGVEFRTVPGPKEIINGKVTLSQLREVRIEDLLERDLVQLDSRRVGSFIGETKTVMVTGAAGSIGSELCRQILGVRPKKLVLYDRAENNLFYLNHELRALQPEACIHAVVGDVMDITKTKSVIEEFSPDVIFHAAAFKHVPLMEFHPEEAIKNNVIGTMNVATLATEADINKFILISTDKAVNPTSVMGASKKLAELYIQGLNTNGKKTRFITVRFGNVLASDGSVVTLFQKQITNGGPVTVTDPEMKRYFMTIEEAVQLILQASAMGKGGEIFILDMGKQINILDMARHLITLSGHRPDETIMIEFIGRRPGEKLYEELWSEDEVPKPTDVAKIFTASSVPYDWSKLCVGIQELHTLSLKINRRGIIQKLKEMIPDYQPNFEI